MRYACIILLVTGVFIACTKSELSRGPRPLVPVVPANFPAFPGMPHNPLTIEGVELGRKLFYDKRLSGLNNISCASCHQQDLAFADGVAFSNIGASGKLLHRNAPALFNMAWVTNGLFWEGGSTNLESQAFAPLANPDEMHQNLFELVDELKADPDYRQRFQFVFNDTEIKTGYIARALAQFQRTLISGNSRYDKFTRGEKGGTLNEEEKRGLQIVQEKCMGCHQGALFTDNLYHNNGLDADFSNEDFEGIFQGRFRVTRDPADLGKYKTPSLRNLFWTGPYMHDGRFNSVMDVLNHYSTGVKNSPTLDSRLKRSNGETGIDLTQVDKQAIISYLKTLSDTSFILNKNFSQP